MGIVITVLWVLLLLVLAGLALVVLAVLLLLALVLVLVALVLGPLLIILALVIPIRYQVDGNFASDTDEQTIIGWFFSLFRINYHVESKHGTHGNLQAVANWLFGLLSVTFNYTGKEEPVAVLEIGPISRPLLSGDKDDTAKKDKKKKKKKVPKPKSTKESVPLSQRVTELRDLLEEYEAKAILELAKSLVIRLLSRILPKRFLVRGVVGFDDPCSTGLFIGMYESTAAVLDVRDNVDLYGNFSEAYSEVEMDVAGRFTIGSLLRQILWFAFQRPVRRIIRENFIIFRKVMWFSIKQGLRWSSIKQGLRNVRKGIYKLISNVLKEVHEVVSNPFTNPFKKPSKARSNGAEVDKNLNKKEEIK